MKTKSLKKSIKTKRKGLVEFLGSFNMDQIRSGGYLGEIELEEWQKSYVYISEKDSIDPSDKIKAIIDRIEEMPDLCIFTGGTFGTSHNDETIYFYFGEGNPPNCPPFVNCGPATSGD